MQRVAYLQRAIGNHAVSRLLAPPTIQRTMWEYQANKSWKQLGGTDTRSTDDLELTAKASKLQPGDRYDDAAHKLFSSGRVSISAYGTVENKAARETKVRAAIVDAAQRLDRTIGMLESSYSTKPPKVTDASLVKALGQSFPLLQTATDEADVFGRFLLHILSVLRKVQTGLFDKDTEIKLVGKLGWSPTQLVDWVQGAENSEGWVSPDWGETATDLMQNKPAPFKERSSAIHLTTAGESAFTVIHEASHKYAGTEDYQYSSRKKELDEDTQEAKLSESLKSMEGLDSSSKAKMLEQYTTARAKRKPGDPATFKDPKGRSQENWYAMGQRALMNADSYAQLVMTATGDPMPRLPDEAAHDHGA